VDKFWASLCLALMEPDHLFIKPKFCLKQRGLQTFSGNFSPRAKGGWFRDCNVLVLFVGSNLFFNFLRLLRLQHVKQEVEVAKPS
jgi:hypothetical protein